MTDQPEIEEVDKQEELEAPKKRRWGWVWTLLLVEIILMAAYFRFVGLNWDQNQHLHPDERFLTMVTSSITPPASLSGYFNTDLSTLNPNNVGYGFYVYGDLPIFIVRYIAGWLDQVGYDQVYLVGRVVSASLDLFTILLIYLLALELFKNKRLALLAAAFDALAVLQIQLSHYFTVDVPANFFIFLALYVAVRIQSAIVKPVEGPEQPAASARRSIISGWKGAIPYGLFGLFAGMALASKVSAWPLVLILPAATYVWWDRQKPEGRKTSWPVVIRNLVVGGVLCLLAFRIFMPYAFDSGGLLGIINPKWWSNMQEVLAQQNGQVDAPFALQWIRRPITFAFSNLVQWGLGLPLGILSMAGLLWMGWRMIRGEWRKYLVLWGWTAGFFVYGSLQGNPTMRYLIPIYPTLAIIAAWLVFQIWDSKPAWLSRISRIPWQKIAAFAIGFGVLGATFAWALAFSQIYLRPVTRVAATDWIYQNIPGPINLHIQDANGTVMNQPMPYPNNSVIQFGKPDTTIFTPPAAGAIAGFTLPKVAFSQLSAGTAQLEVDVTDYDGGNLPLARGTVDAAASNSDQPYTVTFDDPILVQANHRYAVSVGVTSTDAIVQITAPLQYSFESNFVEQSVTIQNQSIQTGQSISAPFTAQHSGTIGSIRAPVSMAGQEPPFNQVFSMAIFDRGTPANVLGTSTLKLSNAMTLNELAFALDSPVTLEVGNDYLVVIQQVSGGQPTDFTGDVDLQMSGDQSTQVLPYPVQLNDPGQPYLTNLTANYSGSLSEIRFPFLADEDPKTSGVDNLVVALSDSHDPNTVIAQGQVSQDFHPTKVNRGYDVTVKLDKPVTVTKDDAYILRIELKDHGALALRGSAPANESSWDDGLPLRTNNYDGYSGIYQPDLNFEMYWDDNTDKVQRFEAMLQQSDYIFITSNRQWATIPRVQERYPLSTAYYRDLLGCPPTESILNCYAEAQPGMFTGKLGFKLIQVFESDPNLGSIKFNDQLAEEAFTVYDHPKVLIFQKTSDYSQQTVANLLSSVNLSLEVKTTPNKPPSYPANLQLPDYILAQQQVGGTWWDLFSRDFLINQSPVFSLILWYLAILALGWIIYPLVRLALKGLPDHGYPLAKVSAMVILAFIVWMAGSNGIPFTQGTILAATGLLIVVNGGIAYWQRAEMKEEWKNNRRYFVTIELITLAFFALDLLIRLGNPDLWHPAKGGEKPMDFSYLNAVLKSTSFPPYDPWYAGGFINYYYYGFVLIGTIIKGLGIVPAVAYNLALPTLFAMVAMGAFSLGWNLLSARHLGQPNEDPEGIEDPPPARLLGLERKPLLAGISASIGMLILGNLGTVKMIWEGFQLMVVQQNVMDAGNFFQRMGWMFQGIAQFLGGTPMPYNIGEWYWNPSRAIPDGTSITEFPFFTFLYGDPHAHLYALPVTLLALAWGLSILKGRWQWGGKPWGTAVRFSASFLLGGLAIGALRPTNTWDMPAYLGLGVLAVLYSAIRYSQIPETVLPFLSHNWKKLVVACTSAVLLVLLAFFLYQPFANWYAQAYNSFDPMLDTRTPMWAYTMHWGVFLFIIASWFFVETLDWMAKTPVSALSRWVKYRWGALLAALGIIVLAVVLSISIPIAWLAMLLALWALVLILRPGQADVKRAVLVMTGSALFLTFFVEVFVLSGAGRMNTVFKFYLQAWTLFSISAAVALWWLIPPAVRLIRPSWRKVWVGAASLLIFGAALFPILGGSAKIQDRMSSTAPHTLDGMAYMLTSTYSDQNKDMDLSQDYYGILWMQQNVQGSPVIVEANTPVYRWGSRFTIYTGLPGVLGWDYHQTQQREVLPSEWVTDRVTEIKDFYTTTDLAAARQFLTKYNVKYIIVGQLEEAYYPGPGLDKFPAQNGKMWKQVFQYKDTTIYEVIE